MQRCAARRVRCYGGIAPQLPVVHIQVRDICRDTEAKRRSENQRDSTLHSSSFTFFEGRHPMSDRPSHGTYYAERVEAACTEPQPFSHCLAGKESRDETPNGRSPVVVPKMLCESRVTSPEGTGEVHTQKQVRTHSCGSPQGTSAIRDVFHKLEPPASIRQVEHRWTLQRTLRRAQLECGGCSSLLCAGWRHHGMAQPRITH